MSPATRARLAPTLLLLAGLGSARALAGPPYVTDDPEPVPYRHWEIYGAFQAEFTGAGGEGTLPHFEVNYGAIPGVQLHLLAPLAFSEGGGPTTWGPGDLELGTKVRFWRESKWIPQAGTFPLLELPTGSAARGLGAGVTQLFLPIWLQKSFGPWTTYGGGGPWLNLGGDHAHWWFFGWLVQRQLTKNLSLGAELFFQSARPDEEAALRFNIGAVIDLGEHQHLLLSSGRALVGDTVFQYYAAYLLTL